MRKDGLNNYDLCRYKDEYERLRQERDRISIQMEALLTASSVVLSDIVDRNRLDFAHLSNAYSAYSSNDLDSIAFKIVLQTIEDLFLPNSEFTFIRIEEHMSGPYEYVYSYKGNLTVPKLISIKIPIASSINKDNIEKLDWGAFTVSEVIEESKLCNRYNTIVKSDKPDDIRIALMDYLSIEQYVVTDSNS